MDDSLKKLRSAPLVHKWFARRRPEAVRATFDILLDAIGQRRQLTILDPFAGSGSLLLEAKRRGHRFYGVDINPVAAMIADYTLNPPTGESLEAALNQLDERVGEKIREAFAAEGSDGTAEGVTYFHSRVVTCRCGNDLELHHSWLIARRQDHSWAAYLCRYCKSVFTGGVEDEVQCPDCQRSFRWDDGTIRTNIVTCPKCRVTTRLLDLPDVSGTPRHTLVAIEIVEDGKRVFRRPTTRDAFRAGKRPAKGARVCADGLRETPIPAEGRFDPRPISHGFIVYGDLFTDRQLWALGLLADEIRGWPDERLRGALALALSDAAGSNNLLCRYAADWLKLTPAFGIHGYHPVSRPVEGNVWGAKLGRGSFRNCVKKAMRAYRDLASIGEGDQEQGTVICGDSKKIDLPDSSVDAIFTDPPYYDFLDYGDLSDFYHQWLKMCLPGNRWFNGSNAQVSGDISNMRGRNGDSFFEGLAAVFRECIRVLRPGGPLVFSYHHSNPRGWWELLRALQVAGLVVVKHFLVQSELKNGFHSSPGNIKSDAIFVCFSRDSEPAITWPGNLSERSNELSDTDSRMATYASAVERLSRTQRVSTVEELRAVAQSSNGE